MASHPAYCIAPFALLGLASMSFAQAGYSEGFDAAGAVNPGAHGPAGLIAAGWQFVNQSQPQGPGDWFAENFLPQGGSSYVTVNVTVAGTWTPSAAASSWAILPPVPNQAAGDPVTFWVANGEYACCDANAHLELRYSPGGGTDTGSGPNAVGDFTTLLMDIPQVEGRPWTQFTASAPGTGRLAFRFRIAAQPSSFQFFGDFSLDSLTVGDPLEPYPIPGPGETVTWTSAMNPIVIDGTVTVPLGATVNVEPGAHINVLNGGRILLIGSLNAAGSASQPVVITGGVNTFFNDVVLDHDAVLHLAHAQVTARVEMSGRGEMVLADCAFSAPGAVTSIGGYGGVTGVSSFVSVDDCTFNGAGMTLTEATIVLRNCSFDGWPQDMFGPLTLLGCYSWIENVTVNGGPVYIEQFLRPQPTLIDTLSVTNVGGAPALHLRGLDFLIGPQVTLQGSLYPVELEGGLLAGSNVPVSGNAGNVVRASSLSSGTWAALDVPYVVKNDLDLRLGFLTIEPGADLRFEPGAGFAFFAGGELRAQGRPEAPITMRAEGGAWQGLIFQVAFRLPTVENCLIEGAETGVMADESIVTLRGNVFQGNTRGVQSNSGGQVIVRGSRFTDNAVGVQTSPGFPDPFGAGAADLFGALMPNSFEGNAVALEVLNQDTIVDARHNWWGSASGPAAPGNPGGTGQPVAGPGTAIVVPFLAAPPGFIDSPPTVRMHRPFFVMDAGTKVVIAWEADDDGAIVSQRIEFTPCITADTPLAPIAENLPGTLRAWEFSVPDEPCIDDGFLRVVAVDDAGQEGESTFAIRIPNGTLDGAFSNFDFEATHLAGGAMGAPCVGLGNTIDWFLLVDDEQLLVDYGQGNCLLPIFAFPDVSTDLARFALRIGGASDGPWVFSPTFTIRPDARVGDAAPTVTLTSPAGGSYSPGSALPITWSASDDRALRWFDVQVSYNAGHTWNFVARRLPSEASSLAWPIPPSTGVPDARVRVIARDTNFQATSAGSEGTTGSFTILPGPAPSPGDVNGDGLVNITDFLALLSSWGPCPPTPCPADLDADGAVGIVDFLILLGNWT